MAAIEDVAAPPAGVLAHAYEAAAGATAPRPAPGGFAQAQVPLARDVVRPAEYSAVVRRRGVGSEAADVREVMVAIEESSQVFGLTVEIRSRLLHAYRELLQMSTRF